MKIGTLCYIKRNGKSLMMHRIKKPDDMLEGKWVGLGGKMENGESPEECIIREVYEESGLSIENPELKGIITFPKDFNTEDWYVFVFRCEKFSGKLKNESHEGVLEWISDNELEHKEMFEGDRIFQKLIDKKGLFSAKFEYDHGKLIRHDIKIYG